MRLSPDKGRNGNGAVPTEASWEPQHMSMKTHGVSLVWARNRSIILMLVSNVWPTIDHGVDGRP